MVAKCDKLEENDDNILFQPSPAQPVILAPSDQIDSSTVAESELKIAYEKNVDMD